MDLFPPKVIKSAISKLMSPQRIKEKIYFGLACSRHGGDRGIMGLTATAGSTF